MLVPSPTLIGTYPVTESFALPPDPRWNAMPDLNYTATIPLVAIESDVCPKCQGPMMLSRIMPGRLNFDLRTFECVKCDHVEKVLAATDPMHSNVLGWFLGELRPPK
jgi:hypothetical protein